ncbi:Uncharacterised protein [Acinetobacter phage MD-2021a]|nr:Uncharacterised protein [Acinetobacter phage MD-2021a]CAH1089019.1 Uncharacterised protein [Acinetobacter phage MD-2021a]
MEFLNDVNHTHCIGKTFRSNNFGEFIVKSYINSKNIEIEFVTTGSKVFTQLNNIRKGQVKDPYYPSVYGVGVLGAKYAGYFIDTYGKKKIICEYRVWQNMISRCYSEKKHIKQPTYKGCSVSENFKHYEYFYEWCNRQIGFGNQGWNLDKDLLVKGNKVYSEDTCVFLPRELNNLTIKSDSIRGEYPIGVSYKKCRGKFTAHINYGSNGQKNLGYYKTPEEAFYAYKEAKEGFIKEQALKWKDKIDPRAFQALMNYVVDIKD